MLDPNVTITGTNSDHSREHSLSESNGSVVNVVSILTHNEHLKVLPESDITPLRMLLKSGDNLADSTKCESNLVTIVQTSSDPVIVTVSGSQMSTNFTNANGSTTEVTTNEMEILAHL